MTKKNEYIVGIVTFIVGLILITATISLAGTFSTSGDEVHYVNEGGTTLKEIWKPLKYNGEAQDIGDFVKNITYDETYREDLINKWYWNDDDGLEGLDQTTLTYRGAPAPEPISFRSGWCLAHNTGNKKDGEHVYRIINAVDVEFDWDTRRPVLKNNTRPVEHEKATEYAAKLSYALYLNSYETNAGENLDQEWTGHKRMVVEIIKDLVSGNIIPVDTLFVPGNVEYNDDGGQEKVLATVKKKVEEYATKVDKYEYMENKSEYSAEERKQYNVNINNKGYTMVGPFRMSFSSLNGIESISINGKKYTTDNTEDIYWVKVGTGDYNDSSIWKKDWKNAPRWEYFYLAIKNDVIPSSNSSYNIEFTQVPIEFYKSRWLFVRGSRFTQQLGVGTASAKTTTLQGVVTYPITHTVNGKITIEKVSKEDSKQKIQGVKLKVYGKTANGNGWLKTDGTLTANYGQSATYETGADGRASFENLQNGSYYIYEVETAEGYNLEDQRSVYTDNKDPNGFAGKTDYGKCVYLTTTNSANDTVNINGMVQYSYGSVTVEKISKTDDNKKISGVSIKIYGKTSDGNGWVKEDGTLGTYAEGKTFVTGQNGTITAGNLRRGTYYAYEIGVAEGYDLNDQRAAYPDSSDPNGFAGKTEYGKAVYLGNVECNSNAVKLAAKRQYPYGDLTIEKIDKSDDSIKIKGVSLKIYGKTSSGNGWVKGDGTVGSYSDGKTFVTGDNGKVTATKLRRGTYYVYEIGTASGYDLEDQRSIYPNSNDPNGFAGKTEYGKAVYLGNIECNSASVKLAGKRQCASGSLTIEKVAKDDANKKISGVKLKIYGDTSSGKGWVKEDGTLGTFAEGKTFVTGDNGKVTATNLRRGTYYVYETEAASGYALDDQRDIYPDNNDPNGFAGKADYGKAVYLGNIECNSAAVKMPAKRQCASGSLTIEKVAKDDANQKISGVKLKLYGDTSIGKGWIKEDGTIGDYQSANTYVTGQNGIVTAGNLRRGTYYIYEVATADGYNLDDQRQVYVDSNDPNGFAGNDKYEKCVYLGKAECNSTTVKLPAKKQYPEGSIKIEKVNKDNSTQKIAGVSLKVYGDTSGGKGWVKADGTLTTFDKADTFVTGKDGFITVNHLRKGTYYVYETATAEGYDLEDQRTVYADSRDSNGFAGKAEYGKAVYITKVSCNSSVGISTGNKQYPEGSIKVEKVDKNDTNKKIKGVQLKIYGDTTIGKGWLKADGTLADYKSSTIFTTGNDGTITAKNIRRGTYYIYEIATPEGYELEDQREVYPDSNDPNKFAGNQNYGKGVYIGTIGCSFNTAILSGRMQYPQGKIIIEKVDLNNTNKKIQGVKLKVYGETTIGKGWIKADGTVTSNYNEAKTYSTGSDGKATIEKLRRGTYYIYEIDVPEGYDLEDQRLLYPDSKDPNGFAGNTAYDECVYLTTADSKSNTVNINAVKQKPQTPRDLTITKIDKNKNEKVSGAGFKVLQKLSRKFKQKGTTYEKNTYVWLKQDGTVTTNVKEAYEFKTGNDGTVTVKNILSYGTCHVYEVTAGGDYELLEQEEQYLQGKPKDYQGDFLGNEWVYMGSTEITTGTGTTISFTAKNEHSLGDLTIIKKDATYKNDLGANDDIYLEGAKVKLYGKVAKDGKTGWVKKVTLSNGKTKYDVGSFKEATEFTTDKDGKVTIDHLRYGTYYVYETKAPNGYDITKQDGYHKQNQGSQDLGNGDWAYLGTTTINYELGDNITYEVGNYKYIDSIKGKVWVDKRDTKLNNYDHLYTESNEDKLLDGVKVRLINKDGKEIATAETKNGGEYVFSAENIGRKLTYWEVANYYVEFVYDNTKYIIVNPFEGGNDKITINSKAQEEEITANELNDNNLTGTEGNTPGLAITYKGHINNLNKETLANNAKGDLNTRLLTGYYNEQTNSIENVNLGLIEKFTPDHQIGEEIEYVKMTKGNYTFTYKYGEAAATEEGKTQSTVKFQNSSKKSFTQKVYPSDVIYNKANSTDSYKIYVVYKISVHNNTAENEEDLYSEQSLCLKSLTNTYDTSRYELSHDKLSGDDEGIHNAISRWTNKSTNTSTNTAQYNINDTKFSQGIESGGTESTYIQFKVTDQALTSLLTDKQLGESPTAAKSVGYHKYTRKDKNWKDNNTYNHISLDEEREDGSLYLKWQLFSTRTISGTVFEDGKDDSRGDERIGDGKFDSSTEKTLSDVVVSLMNAEDTGNADKDGRQDEEAYLYGDEQKQNIETGKWERCKQKAVVKADANGRYELKGVVPGKYYLKFTYGDGHTEIQNVNLADTVATKIAGQTDAINVNNYKSTIFTKDATNESQWYLNMDGDTSIATDRSGIVYDSSDGTGRDIDDIITYRTTLGENKEINYSTIVAKMVIHAQSPNMDVGFEYIGNDSYQVEDNGFNDLKTDCSGMSFGIIERPHTDIQLEKTITNVKLTLSNGTNLVNGNPADQNVSQYITDMGNSTVKLETDYANIYGATVEVSYAIKILNNSELDYATKAYYTTGEKGSAEPVKTAVTKIVDYISENSCGYVSNSENIEAKDDYATTDNPDAKKEDYYAKEVIDANKKYPSKVLIPKSLTYLEPKSANPDDNSKSETEYNITVSRLMPSSSTTSNLGWNSYSEILAITNKTFNPQYSSDSGSLVVDDTLTSEPDDDTAILTITPPTGKNKDYTVYVVIVGMLTVVVAGVVVIKKFVL